jgi:hypothetical protein
MAEGKKSFIAYSDWKDTFDTLPDEVAGKLIKHIFAYVNDENPSTDDYIINGLFANIKNSLKRDLEKWENQRQQRVLAGKKSAEIRATKKNERSTTVNETERNPTVSVNDSVSDNVNKNNNKRRNFIPPTTEQIKAYCLERKNNIDAQRFIDHYSSNGWMVGKNKMKDWKAAVRTWEKNNFNNSGQTLDLKIQDHYEEWEK